MLIKLKDGTNIYYEGYKGSKGLTLVFLHGNLESGDSFLKQKEYFKDKYDLLFLDTRGQGRSEFGKGSYNLRKLAEDLREILAYLAIKDYILIGFSDGANIVMEYSCRYEASGGEGLKGLILIGGNLKVKGLKPIVRLEIYLQYFLKKENEKRIIALMLDKGSYKYEDLRKIKVPTLVLAGSKDMVKDKETRRISDNLYDGRLRIIKGGNHFFIYEKSDLANKIIEEFIEERGN